MNLDFFLSTEEIDRLALEVEKIKLDIQSTDDEYIIDAKIMRLDQIIQTIQTSKRNICQNQQVVRLF